MSRRGAAAPLRRLLAAGAREAQGAGAAAAAPFAGMRCAATRSAAAEGQTVGA
jgi:hypothetical protein